MFSKRYTLQFPEKIFNWSNITGRVKAHGIEATWKFAILEIDKFVFSPTEVIIL